MTCSTSQCPEKGIGEEIDKQRYLQDKQGKGRQSGGPGYMEGI